MPEVFVKLSHFEKFSLDSALYFSSFDKNFFSPFLRYYVGIVVEMYDSLAFSERWKIDVNARSDIFSITISFPQASQYYYYQKQFS